MTGPETSTAAPPRGRRADARTLRAIAHPLRNRILGELEATGPLRAADVARLAGVPANQASFHLRQLAKYGLVEEAPDLARDRRDRVWRMVDDEALAVSINEIEATPGGRAAAQVWRRQASATAHELVDRAYHGPRLEGTVGSIMESTARLTTEQAHEMARELDALAARWLAVGRDNGVDEGRTYVVFAVVQPYGDDG